MSAYSRKLLVASVIVAWICVFVKYESMALLSRSSGSSGSRSSSSSSGSGSKSSSGSSSGSSGSRLRQTVRNAYHRVVDSKPTNTESSHRIRQTIRDGYHKIGDKFSSGSSGHSSGGGSGLSGHKKLLATSIFSSLTRKISHSRSGAGGVGVVGGGVAGGLAGGAIGHNSHIYQTGYYNGYNYRPDRYAKVRGSLCTNNIPYESGISLGQFYCPIEGFDYQDTYCCGPDGEQYCCDYREHKAMYGSAASYSSSSYSAPSSILSHLFLFFFIILPMFFLFLLVVCFVFCILKFKLHRKLFTKSADSSSSIKEVEEATSTASKEETEGLKAAEATETTEDPPPPDTNTEHKIQE